MKRNFYIFSVVFFMIVSVAGAQQLPRYMTHGEKAKLDDYMRQVQSATTMNVTPPTSPVRTIGEWEELQGFLIAWKTYPTMLREIVRAAKQECRVYIAYEAPDSPTSIMNYLAAGSVDTVNVSFMSVPLNSVWSRDYGPWSAYTNDVDTLITIDWIYNRPRPDDDVVPVAVASWLNTPLYQTTTAPWDLVHTGGNFMTDGFGTGFSSNLILTDNSPAGGFGVTHTPAEIDTIMSRFMGINRYIRMNTLPYDQIHHIDMHMKLLDEETLVMGEYPAGIADGPQIEANLQYILANFPSVYGTPYKVIRIPMPDDNGAYPSNGGDYFTYTNSSFVNKTLIVPTYNIPEDTTALNIYKNALPGYTIVGINSTASIGALGALHCITKELGTDDPLLISHQALHDTCDALNPYNVTARIQHRSGIASATLYYRTDTLLPYQAIPMVSLSWQINSWGASIPAQPANTTVYYYIGATANSGKQQVRPLPAPAGYWHFKIDCPVGMNTPTVWNEPAMQPVFPNPSKGITCIPVYTSERTAAKIDLFDITGKHMVTIFDGETKTGKNNFFVNTIDFSPGVYILRYADNSHQEVQMLIVR